MSYPLFAADNEGTERFPERVYVTNESGKPSDTDIFDADTGKKFEGVFRANIDGGKVDIEVEASRSWPVKPEDHVVNDDAYTGESIRGIKTGKKTYRVKRMQIESW